jgi:hypothetical protein
MKANELVGLLAAPRNKNIFHDETLAKTAPQMKANKLVGLLATPINKNQFHDTKLLQMIRFCFCYHLPSSRL